MPNFSHENPFMSSRFSLKFLFCQVFSPRRGIFSTFGMAFSDIFSIEVQVSSVDAFQGCQKDVIILSLVRANPRPGCPVPVRPSAFVAM